MKFKSGTRILIYGDSNTWGSDANDMRYATETQWPVILQSMLGDDYEIVQEGLCGRIAGNHDESEPHRNGHTAFEVAMRSASPFDYLIVALGSNDLKKKYGLSAVQIIDDLIWYKARSERYNQSDADMQHRFKKVFYVGIANFKPNNYVNVEDGHATRNLLMDSGETVIELMDLEHSADGVHYTEADHQTVASRVFDTIKEYENEV